jgi:WD40 repeat protein
MLVLNSGRSIWIDKLAFAPSGTVLAAPAGVFGVLFWNALTSGATAEGLEVPVPSVRRLAFTPDGEYLLAADNHLCAVRLATRAAVQYPVNAWDLGFVPMPDSASVIVSERQPLTDTRYTRWALPPTDKPVWEVKENCYSRGGQMLLGADRFALVEWKSNDGLCLTVRSAETGEVVSKASGLPEYPENVALAPDAAFVACQARAGIHVQPLNGPFHTKLDVRNTNRKHFTGIAYHPSGRYLAATSNDATVKLYDTSTWEVVRAFTWDIGRMRSICFSPDGALAAAGSDRGKVVVWDVDV